MAGLITLTEKNFEATVQKGGTLFIDFTATWCAPCGEFAPIFEAASKKHGTVMFGRVDVDAEEALADEFEIEVMPTIVAIRDGVLVASEEGLMTAEEFEEIIAGVAALDMNGVRADLEADEAAEATKAAKKAPAKKAAAKKAPAKKVAAKKAPAKKVTAKVVAKKTPAKKPAAKKVAAKKAPAKKKSGR